MIWVEFIDAVSHKHTHKLHKCFDAGYLALHLMFYHIINWLASIFKQWKYDEQQTNKFEKKEEENYEKSTHRKWSGMHKMHNLN